MVPERLAELADLRRARDFIDRCYAEPLDVPAMAEAARMAVGCTSLGSFSARFSEIVGVSPSEYRQRDHRSLEVVPPCVAMRHLRLTR